MASQVAVAPPQRVLGDRGFLESQADSLLDELVLEDTEVAAGGLADPHKQGPGFAALPDEGVGALLAAGGMRPRRALLHDENVGLGVAGEKQRLGQLGGHAVQGLGGALARRGLVVQVGLIFLGDRGQLQPTEIPNHQLFGQIRARQGVVEHRRQQPFGPQPLQRDQQIVVDGDPVGPALPQNGDQLLEAANPVAVV